MSVGNGSGNRAHTESSCNFRSLTRFRRVRGSKQAFQDVAVSSLQGVQRLFGASRFALDAQSRPLRSLLHSCQGAADTAASWNQIYRLSQQDGRCRPSRPVFCSSAVPHWECWTLLFTTKAACVRSCLVNQASGGPTRPATAAFNPSPADTAGRTTTSCATAASQGFPGPNSGASRLHWCR